MKRQYGWYPQPVNKLTEIDTLVTDLKFKVIFSTLR